MAAKTGTYSLIDSTTLGSAQSSVTFSSIPATFTDLVLVVAGTVNTNSYFALRLNSDTGNNYSNTEMDGNGTAASSNRNTNNSYMYNGSILTTQTNVINQIQDYSNTTTNKTVLTRSNNAGSIVKVSVGLWRSTAAITSIECSTAGANTFSSGSTFKLYGIEAGNIS
jgi:hypothetical protein